MERARTTGHLALLAIAALAGGCGNGGSSSTGTNDEPWTHATASWSSLYTEYFGPAGVASCTAGSNCHSSLDQTGGTASNFVCTDKDGCFTALTGASQLVRAKDVADPASAPLFHKLRQTDGTGTMPSSSDFVFQPEDVDLIKTWIGKGAKND